MTWRDLKYLASFLLPVAGILAVTLDGIWTYSGLIFAFVIIPLVEIVVPRSTSNLTAAQVDSKLGSVYFDALLYVNIPIVYGLVYVLLTRVHSGGVSTTEIVGMVGSVGTVLGAAGINVAHELGHKQGSLPQAAARLLLLPCLYMHFVIEHNRGHHLHIGTPADPATSRYGEVVYAFWFRSTWGSYRHAWTLEADRLTGQGKAVLSLDNEMLRFTLIQSTYLLLVLWLGGWLALLVAIAVAVVAFLLLETINYIEHYGLQRKKMANGRYERVEVFHSWNSNHEFGRLVLYELTRHSDHHYIASKKYQVLSHHDASPQLPLGYPGSMLLSFVPPLWFKMMNPLVQDIRCRS